MNQRLDYTLQVLQKSVAEQVGRKVDLYYLEGRGALVVPHNHPLHPNFVLFALPEEMIRMGANIRVNFK